MAEKKEKPISSILPCKCSHEFQDRQYGKGMRAHTYATKDKVYKCTVCGGKARWIERIRIHAKEFIANSIYDPNRKAEQ